MNGTTHDQRLDDAFSMKMRGVLTAEYEDRQGRVWTEVLQNTVVKGAYEYFLEQATGTGVDDEEITTFVMGDNPAPTSWETEYSDMTVVYSQAVTSISMAWPTITLYTEVAWADANGGIGAQHTYYEVALVTGSNRLFSRVAPRGPGGAIAGILKKEEYKIRFTWVISWGDL